VSFGATAPPLILEGDYSSWAEIWEYSFTDDLDSTSDVWLIFGVSYAYLHYEDDQVSKKRRFAVIDLSDGSNHFISDSGVEYTNLLALNDIGIPRFNQLVNVENGGMAYSIRGKYLMISQEGNTTFEVWKEGTKVWTSPTAATAVSGASNYESVAISHDGKYIIALVDTKKLVCFEGS